MKELVLETKNYGLIAYVILKYNGKRVNTGVSLMVEKDVTSFDIKKEYISSEFLVYNEILKDVVKGK